MYSHIVKGFSVGQLLTRRVLRRFTSIPGVVIDGFAAMFWAPNYRDYWNNYIPYADNTRAGLVEGGFGWIGEAMGMGLGGMLGSVLGVVVYGVDSVFSLVRFVQENLYNAFDRLDRFIIEIAPSVTFPIEMTPEHVYIIKAWNIGSFILGGLIAAGPLLITKTLEFLIPPLEEFLSNSVMFISGILGGSVMSSLAIPLYPAVYLFKRSMELYSSLRETVRFSVAVVYGKTDTVPALDDNNDLDLAFPLNTLHSPEFREDVRYANRSSWAVLISNGFHRAAPPVAVAVIVPAQDYAVVFPPLGSGLQAQPNPPPAYCSNP